MSVRFMTGSLFDFWLHPFTRALRLTIVSDPGFAEIFINGKPTGEITPKVHPLKPGTYRIQVKKENYYPSQEKEYTVGYDIFEGSIEKADKISFELKKIE